MSDTQTAVPAAQEPGKKGQVTGDWTVTIKGTPEVRTQAREAGYGAQHASGFVFIDIPNTTKENAQKIASDFGEFVRIKSAGLLLGG